MQQTLDVALAQLLAAERTGKRRRSSPALGILAFALSGGQALQQHAGGARGVGGEVELGLELLAVAEVAGQRVAKVRPLERNDPLVGLGALPRLDSDDHPRVVAEQRGERRRRCAGGQVAPARQPAYAARLAHLNHEKVYRTFAADLQGHAPLELDRSRKQQRGDEGFPSNPRTSGG